MKRMITFCAVNVKKGVKFMIGVVYGVECLIHHKIYVGQTTQPLTKRIDVHGNANSILGKDIRKFGLENFKIVVLAECNTLNELKEGENFWIKKLNCKFPNGYNRNNASQNPVRFNLKTAPDQMSEFPALITFYLLRGKWTPYILEKLIERPYRFNELKKSLAGINHKVLIEQLRQMEDDGIILRQDNGTFPRRVEYSLSELGKMMLPIIQSLHDFGTEYKKILAQK